MFRILGKISIYGTRASVERLALGEPIPNSVLERIGELRAKPDPDFWCYGSQRYQFHPDTLDEEVRNFLVAHRGLTSILANPDTGIRHAIFGLYPVDQVDEEIFSCLLENKTLGMLSSLGLSLEIAPATVMPESVFWSDATSKGLASK